jgi:hypothetical protein
VPGEELNTLLNRTIEDLILPGPMDTLWQSFSLRFFQTLLLQMEANIYKKSNTSQLPKGFNTNLFLDFLCAPYDNNNEDGLLSKGFKVRNGSMSELIRYEVKKIIISKPVFFTENVDGSHSLSRTLGFFPMLTGNLMNNMVKQHDEYYDRFT